MALFSTVVLLEGFFCKESDVEVNSVNLNLSKNLTECVCLNHGTSMLIGQSVRNLNSVELDFYFIIDVTYVVPNYFSGSVNHKMGFLWVL